MQRWLRWAPPWQEKRAALTLRLMVGKKIVAYTSRISVWDPRSSPALEVLLLEKPGATSQYDFSVILLAASLQKFLYSLNCYSLTIFTLRVSIAEVKKWGSWTLPRWTCRTAIPLQDLQILGGFPSSQHTPSTNPLPSLQGPEPSQNQRIMSHDHPARMAQVVIFDKLSCHQKKAT